MFAILHLIAGGVHGDDLNWSEAIWRSMRFWPIKPSRQTYIET